VKRKEEEEDFINGPQNTRKVLTVITRGDFLRNNIASMEEW
jgi:hypothetical protein